MLQSSIEELQISFVREPTSLFIHEPICLVSSVHKRTNRQVYKCVNAHTMRHKLIYNKYSQSFIPSTMNVGIPGWQNLTLALTRIIHSNVLMRFL